jgi:signal peptidase II
MRHSRYAGIGTAVLVVFLDQLSKAWAEGSLSSRREVTVINGWLWFRLTRNSGATLGLLMGHNLFLAGVSLLIVVGVAWALLRGSPGGVLGAAALGSIAGGALSNVLDRMRLGGVVDFVQIRLWPADFNLADAAIRFGVVIFLLALALDLVRRRRQTPGPMPSG